MLESDFEELLDEYISGTIADKDFLTLVSAAGTNPKWRKRFEDAEKALEMSSDSFLDKSKTRFKANMRTRIENIKSTMRKTQEKQTFFSKSYFYFLLFLVVIFLGIYPQIFIKKTSFALMVIFFQILSTVVLLAVGVYVFFFRGKD